MTIRDYHGIPHPFQKQQIRITCGKCRHKVWVILKFTDYETQANNWIGVCPYDGFINYPVKDGYITCQVVLPT